MNNKLLDIFTKIVQINSTSGNEKHMRNYLLSWLKNNKFLAKVDKVGNVYAMKGNITPSVLFCAHMDTVNPGIGIKPIVKNGIIKSSGDTILGADNKAFIASLLFALEEYRGERKIEVIFSVKEETGGGIELFPFQWIRSNVGFIFDNANPVGGIVLQSPYIYNFHVEFKGKAAHAATPHLGKNALVAATAAIRSLPIGKSPDGKMTLNVGLIKGGTGINTVPDFVQIHGEIRSYDKEIFKKYIKHIELIYKMKAKQYAISINFWKDGYCPGYSHSKSNRMIKLIKEIYNNLDLNTKFYMKSGISDGNILNEKGVQTFVLTDGVESPHTINEEISLNSLAKMRNIIYAIIVSNDKK